MTTPHSALGHVVLNVVSLERSIPFYRDALGLREVARLAARERGLPWGDMVFFSFGANHHDIALREVPGGAAHDRDSVGLFHVALRVGSSLDELCACKLRLQSRGVHILRARDHRVAQSIYVADPDGIVIEAYVDADPQIWRTDPSAVATGMPLYLPD